MMRLGRVIILSSVVSVSVFDQSVQAQATLKETLPARVETLRRSPPDERPATVRSRAEAGFGTFGRDGNVGGRTDVPMDAAEPMASDDFSYGTVIPATGQPGKRVRMRTVVRPVAMVVQFEVPEEEEKEAQQIRELIKKLRETNEDDEEQRTALTKSIQAIFSTQFERDLKQREDALAPLETRVKALRKQLDKRKAAAGEIIDLRLKMIVNEIDGLTFPGEEGNVEETTVPARRRAMETFNPDPFTEPRRRSTDAPSFDPNETGTDPQP